MPIMTVEEKVRNILAEHLGVDEEEITPEASIVNDLGADSMDTLEFVMVCEEEFGIEVPDEDAKKLDRVADIVSYINDRLTAKK